MTPAAELIDLATEHGTPLYAYDLDQVDQRCSELVDVLPPDSSLYYSVKANPLPALVQAARLAGCRAEISSEGELAAALAAGFAGDAMLYTGPAKGPAELDRAIAAGVRCFSAESWRDLQRVDAAAAAAGTTASVVLRVNPAVPPRAGLVMTGAASQFGFEEADLGMLAERLDELGNVVVSGIHTYLGTQIQVSALVDAFAVAADVAERASHLFDVRIIDLGGGFPWPYAVMGQNPDLAPLRPPLEALVGRHAANGAEVWFESGRYVAASCGTLVATVLDVKRSRDTNFVVLDAGVSTLGGMPALGRLIHPVVSLSALGNGSAAGTMRADVVGPLCTPLDCIGRGVTVPLVAPGALVAIPNVGAYGATASLTSFLSRPPAKELALRGGRVVEVATLRTGHERVTLNSSRES